MNSRIRLATNTGFSVLIAYCFVLAVHHSGELTDILLSGILVPAVLITVFGRIVDHRKNHITAKLWALLITSILLILFSWLNSPYLLSSALVLCYWSGHLLNHATEEMNAQNKWPFIAGLLAVLLLFWVHHQWADTLNLVLQMMFGGLALLFLALIMNMKHSAQNSDQKPDTPASREPHAPYRDLNIIVLIQALSFTIAGFFMHLQIVWATPCWPLLASAAGAGILISRMNIPLLGYKRNLALIYVILLGLFLYNPLNLQKSEYILFLGFYLLLFFAEHWTITILYKRSLPRQQSAYYTGILILSASTGFLAGYYLEAWSTSHIFPLITLIILMILNQMVYPERASAQAENQPITESPWGNAWHTPNQEAPILSLNTWLKYLQRTLCELFFGKIRVRGLENLANLDNVLFVANHPNTFFDPLFISAIMPYPLHFLAKSTLWKIPVLGSLLDQLGVIPVQRASDTSLEERKKNVTSLGKTAQLLNRGAKILIFPEGVSQTGLTLKPVKTGAARILFKALEMGHWEKDIPIVPLGIDYEKPTTFRSSVTLRIGEPISLLNRKDAYLEKPRSQVIEATHSISRALMKLIPHLDTEEKEKLTENITELYGAQLCHILDSEDPTQARFEIANAIKHYCATDPSAIIKFKERLSTYKTTCRHLDFSDNLPSFSFRNLIKYAKALFSLPTMGLVLHWLPYKTTQKIVSLMPMDAVWWATAKLGTGLIIYPLYYFILHTLIAHSAGALLAYIFVACTFLLGIMALGNYNRYDFLFQPMEAVWSAYWHRDTQENICQMKTLLLQDLERFREAYAFYLEEMKE